MGRGAELAVFGDPVAVCKEERGRRGDTEAAGEIRWEGGACGDGDQPEHISSLGQHMLLV